MSELKGCVLVAASGPGGAVLLWQAWWGRLCLVAVRTCPVGPLTVGLAVALWLGHTGRDSLWLLAALQPVPGDGDCSLFPCAAPLRFLFSPRLPSSWKALSSLQASHLWSSAGKYSNSGKAEMRPAASHSRQRARCKGFEAVVGGDGLHSCCPA